MKKKLFYLFVACTLASCRTIYPDLLFKAPRNYPYASADSVTLHEYLIQPGDRFQMAVFSNNGYDLVDVFSVQGSGYIPVNFLVDQSGNVQLPMLDSVSVVGLSVGQVENLLAFKYSYYFVNPFVKVEIANRYAYVFKGRSGAITVSLDKENMSLLEVIARAGGIPSDAKSNSIKLIRGSLNEAKVYHFDLSKLDNLSEASMVIQPNDMVYLDPAYSINDVFAKISPVLAFVSSLTLLAFTISTLTKP